MSIARTATTSSGLALAAALILCTGFVAGDAEAGVTISVVRGQIHDSGAGPIWGRFKTKLRERNNASHEILAVKVKRLDVGLALVFPTYNVWLVNADRSLQADFGRLSLNRRGRGRLSWSNDDGLPRGVDSLRDFSGGKIEIRDRDSDVVAGGTVPDFLGLEEPNEEGSHARTRGRDKERLTAVHEEIDGKGRIRIRYVNAPLGVRQVIVVKVKGLPPRGGRYTVVAIDDANAEIEIGRLDTFTSSGTGGLRIDTKRGDVIPGGNVNDLARRVVEVRAADATVVLTGAFPEI